ncbi:MAG: 5'/3'-nucleotidase SurE, partial [Dehalococcoidales bacterium]|nr:5'/3'-nucleotidase SurE [Dehalococcoidales bacterium]
LLNVNLPDLPLAEISGVKITRLANESHIDTVEEGRDGRREYYWLVRRRSDKDRNRTTDIWAIERGNISITPLHTYQDSKPAPVITTRFCSDLLQELR